MYYYGIANGGSEEWEFAFDQLVHTSVASERVKLMHGLAASTEPWILSRYSLHHGRILIVARAQCFVYLVNFDRSIDRSINQSINSFVRLHNLVMVV